MAILDIPGNETRAERLARLRRGTFVPGTSFENQGGIGPGRFFNPGRIAGTVPQAAGEWGRGQRSEIRDQIGAGPPAGAARPPVTEPQAVSPDQRAQFDRAQQEFKALEWGGGTRVTPAFGPPGASMLQAPGPSAVTTVHPGGQAPGFAQELRPGTPGYALAGQAPPVAPPVAPGAMGGRQGAMPGQAPVSMVDQMLAGPPGRGQGKEVRATEVRGQTEGMGPSGFGGTMRPINLPAGTDLLAVKAPLTGVEDDPVLATRRQEFDRNLVDYLRRPDWKSREEYERGLTQIPGAGQEIMAHIQQRAMENMPTGMRQEWEQTEANRVASAKALSAAAASEAAYQRFMNTPNVTEAQRTAFHENFERTPEGWKPAKLSSWEKREMSMKNFMETASPAAIAEYEKEYMMTPEGSRRRVTQMDAFMRSEELGRRASGAGAAPAAAPEDKRGYLARQFGTPAAPAAARPPVAGEAMGGRPSVAGEAMGGRPGEFALGEEAAGSPLPTAASGPTSMPVIGEVRKGYRYNGGDPGRPGSWERISE